MERQILVSLLGIKEPQARPLNQQVRMAEQARLLAEQPVHGVTATTVPRRIRRSHALGAQQRWLPQQ